MHTKALMAIAAGLALAACSHQGSESSGTAVRTGPAARTHATPQAHRATTPRSTREIFASGDHYKIDGSVAAVRRGTITIRRKGLPPADLQVARETKIELEGRPARLAQIRPGDEVRATFNVSGERLIAVAVDAKQAKQEHAAKPSSQEHAANTSRQERRQGRTGR